MRSPVLPTPVVLAAACNSGLEDAARDGVESRTPGRDEVSPSICFCSPLQISLPSSHSQRGDETLINRLLSKVGCDSSSHLGKKEFFEGELGLDVRKNFFMESQWAVQGGGEVSILGGI